MIKNILINLDLSSKKKLLLLIISNFIIGILEMISFGSIYIYLKFVLFDELIFKSYLVDFFPIIFEQTKLTQISIFSFFVFFLFLFKNSLLLLLIKLEAKITNDIFFILKRKMSKILIELPYQLISTKYSSDEIMNTFIIDTEKYRYTLTEFVRVCRESILIICLTLLIFLQNFTVSVFTILFFLILSSVVLFFFKPITKKLGKRLRQVDGSLIKQSLNIFLSIKIIKIFRKENYFQNDLVNSLKEYEDIQRKFYILKNLPRLFFELLTIILILTLILFFTHSNNNINELIPLIALISATFIRMMPSFAIINSSLNAIRFNETSTIKLNTDLKFLENNKLQKNIKNSKIVSFGDEKELNINLKNVHFNFKEKTIYDNLNLSISSKSFVSIFGESGSGKSTLLNIISGLFQTSNGKVVVNNIDIQDNLEYWQSKIGYVDQETTILNDTILQNIAFGENEPNVDQFYHVLKKVKLYDFCISLPNKENTVLTEFGKNLSGGQKQRIGIARALYQKSQILLLDEPTSALDEKNENEIFEHLRELKKSLTIIMVTHKTKAKEYSDKSLIINDGKIKDY
jgi:ABC-type multidrug transport system fused ATPase/permease subunit